MSDTRDTLTDEDVQTVWQQEGALASADPQDADGTDGTDADGTDGDASDAADSDAADAADADGQDA